MIVLDDSNYDEVTSKGKVVVDFYADWCGPCHMMAPTFEEAASEYEGKVTLAKLNVDDSKEIAAKNNVMGIPTLIFFKDGQIVDRVSGVIDKGTLFSKIDLLL